jgi:Protein of unknown function (DUF2911)
MNKMRFAVMVAAAGLVLLFTAWAQDHGQSADKNKGQQGAAASQGQAKGPLSPAGSAEVTLGASKVTINYSRPSMRGRKIMGGLVPYGQVWRTGANAATSLQTTGDITIGGTAVPAGKYTLYTLPGENEWKLIISKQTEKNGKPVWGTEYDESQDLARVTLKKEAASSPVEQFTISLDKAGEKSATLRLEWENTRLTAPIQAK